MRARHNLAFICLLLAPSACGSSVVNTAPAHKALARPAGEPHAGPATPPARPPAKTASIATTPAPPIDDPLVKRWNASCPVKTILGGICAKYVAPRTSQARCSAGEDLIELVQRNDDARAVQQLVTQRLARSGAPEAQRALWAFLRAERAFETYLGMKMPTMHTMAEMRVGFAQYLKKKALALKDARRGYLRVSKDKRGPWYHAIVMRIGQLYMLFGQELVQAPLPDVPTPANLTSRSARQDFRRRFIKTFCDTAQSRARPLLQKALSALKRCARRRGPQSIYDRGCHRSSSKAKALLGSAGKTSR